MPKGLPGGFADEQLDCLADRSGGLFAHSSQLLAWLPSLSLPGSFPCFSWGLFILLGLLMWLMCGTHQLCQFSVHSSVSSRPVLNTFSSCWFILCSKYFSVCWPLFLLLQCVLLRPCFPHSVFSIFIAFVPFSSSVVTSCAVFSDALLPYLWPVHASEPGAT